jgi:hypothetical protein
MTDRLVSGAAFDIVSVKGFGDLVIALTCLRRVLPTERRRVRLLVGEHLAPLWAALSPPFAAAVIEHPDAGPAALFQVHSRPLHAIARSALGLRRRLARGGDRSRTLVFDEWDVRHRFLALGRSAVALPGRDNLYQAWNDFLVDQGLVATVPDADAGAVPAPVGRRFHIFPGAREEGRRFPPALLHALVSRAAGMGLDACIFTIAGEMPHLSGLGLPIEELPRDFSHTLAAVAAADRIVSADSMTAHLAEYCGVPVFVLAPREKRYWLPLSAVQVGRHALFAEELDSTCLPTFMG